MKFKSKLRVTKPLTTIYGIISILILSVIFQSCEKENAELMFEKIEFLSIEGDLNDVETLLDIKNVAILNKAGNRFRKNIKLKNEKLTWDIHSGEVIGVSEDIFNYLENSYKIVNDKIYKKEIFAFLVNGDIRTYRKEERKLFSIIRLKSGQTEYDASTMTDNEMSSAINNAFANGFPDNLADFVNMNSVSWNGNSMGMVSADGWSNDGKSHWTMMDGCNGGYCSGNDIVIIDREMTSNGYIDIARNANGSPVVTNRVYY